MTQKPLIRFNSSLVRLGVLQLYNNGQPQNCFNSSLVRLGDASLFIHNPYIPFQFQLGAIGSQRTRYQYRVRRSFQFQLGAIGSFKRRRPGTGNVSVSIPAWCDWEKAEGEILDYYKKCFNSSLVRLGVPIR